VIDSEEGDDVNAVVVRKVDCEENDCYADCDGGAN
jgi:hypothetical protein